MAGCYLRLTAVLILRREVPLKRAVSAKTDGFDGAVCPNRAELRCIAAGDGSHVQQVNGRRTACAYRRPTAAAGTDELTLLPWRRSLAGSAAGAPRRTAAPGRGARFVRANDHHRAIRFVAARGPTESSDPRPGRSPSRGRFIHLETPSAEVYLSTTVMPRLPHEARYFRRGSQ